MKHIKEFMSDFKRTGLLPRLNLIESSSTKPEFNIGRKKFLMFASNNYLGMSDHPDVKEAAVEALKKYGLGPGGSRYLCGNIEILEKLESDLSKFIGKDDAITFPTGYMANMGIFAALLDPFIFDKPHKKKSGVIFSDERNHATIIDGSKLSSAVKEVYRHLDKSDLIERISKYKENHPLLIVTESVFSMEGSIEDIPAIVEIAKTHESMLMVDDAHGIGVIGNTGRGVLEHFNIYNDVDIVMGTLDKALGSMGGFLAGKREIIEYLRVAARPYIFSSSIPAVLAAAASKAIELCQSDTTYLERLRYNIKYLRRNLKMTGFEIMGNAELPAIPVFIGKEEIAIEFSKRVFERGVFSPEVRWPAVDKGSARIRVTVMSHHEQKHLDQLIEVYKQVGKELGVI